MHWNSWDKVPVLWVKRYHLIILVWHICICSNALFTLTRRYFFISVNDKHVLLLRTMTWKRGVFKLTTYQVLEKSICHPLGMWINGLPRSRFLPFREFLNYPDISICVSRLLNTKELSQPTLAWLYNDWSCLKQYNAVLTIKTQSNSELPTCQWLSSANQEKKWKRSYVHLLTSRQFHHNHNGFFSHSTLRTTAFRNTYLT